MTLLLLLLLAGTGWGAEYVVTTSTECLRYDYSRVTETEFECLESRPAYVVFGMSFRIREHAEDLAEALNQAHERRMNPSLPLEVIPVDKGIIYDDLIPVRSGK